MTIVACGYACDDALCMYERECMCAYVCVDVMCVCGWVCMCVVGVCGSIILVYVDGIACMRENCLCACALWVCACVGQSFLSMWMA